MSGSTGLPPIPLYLDYSGNEAKYATNALRADPRSAALVTAFEKTAPRLTTADALLGDFKALTVVLGSFGLQGAIGHTALLRQLLTQDPTDKASLAQKLGNQKYLAFAKAFSGFSPPPFNDPAKIASIVAGYKTNNFELQADKQAPGLQKALYFTRNIGAITTLSQLQSDADLLRVVVTGIGLPPDNFAALSYTQQTAILKGKVDVTRFADPSYVKRFSEQYLIAQQAAQVATAAPPGTLGGLFDDGSDSTGEGLLSILAPGSDTTSGSSGNVVSLFA